MLIGVVVATAIVAAFDLEARGISVLGPLPQGRPAPELS
jgi:MFS superfamily sulfate permease-like transporter